MIIENKDYPIPKPRRGEMIIENKDYPHSKTPEG